MAGDRAECCKRKHAQSSILHVHRNIIEEELLHKTKEQTFPLCCCTALLYLSYVNPFVAAIQHISPLTTEAQDALLTHIQHKQFHKGHELLRIGQVSHHMYFIYKGLARIYYYYNEIDVTTYFAMDNQFLGGIESLFTHQPSQKGIHLLEDSEVYFINYASFEQLCLQYHDIERAGRKMAIYAFLLGQKRIESLRFHDARQRYEELEKQYPGLSNRAPLKHIASYLGITQVSLSRIRAAY
jgi:CRP-like cAMP-binding protein